MRFVPERELREQVEAAIAVLEVEVESVLPACEVVHIGATAVPGGLTKGDVDVLVRVPPDRYEAAVNALRNAYDVNQPENWTDDFASFDAGRREALPCGVQLVRAGSPNDRLLTEMPRRLRADPDLLERYNDLKREHEGADRDAYWEAKARFHEAELGEAFD